jgi:hypothetical protein
VYRPACTLLLQVDDSARFITPDADNLAAKKTFASAHPKTIVFGFARPAISDQLPEKSNKNNLLAEN